MLKLLSVIESQCTISHFTLIWEIQLDWECVLSYVFIVNNILISVGGGGRFKQGNAGSCKKYDIIIPAPISRRQFARDIFLK